MARKPENLNEFPRVATLKKRGKIYEAEAAFGSENSVFIGRKALHGARPGDLVVLRPAGRGRGEVARSLGKASSLATIMEGIMAWFQFPRGFSSKALDEAVGRARLAEKKDARRCDLTNLATVTIDPDEARDYDDAISLEGSAPGELTLYVHIADVSYYVSAGSAVDREAAKKSNSVYLPVLVEPMLPPVYSSDACSLRPGVPRKTVTVEMVFAGGQPDGGDREAGGDFAPHDGSGRKERPAGRNRFRPENGAKGEPPVLKEVRFYRSLIRSRRRLTYNEVDDFFKAAGSAAAPGAGLAGAGAPTENENPGREAFPAEIRRLLLEARRLAGVLKRTRHQRGALNISTFEPEFRLSPDGEILSARPRPESESHSLIEEFMIAANEAVAGFLESRQNDCVYRVHEDPDAAAVDALFDTLEDLGIPTPSFSLKTGSPAKAAEAVRELVKSLPRLLKEQQRSRSAFGEIVLRSLKQARYLEENLGHFGLASPAYLHFTSPIRRYPDLVVHRALLRELHHDGAGKSSACPNPAEVAESSSEAERRAAAAEHLGDDVALAFLLDRLLFEEGWDRQFAGEIISVIPSGLFIRFEQIYEGYLPARSLWGDYFAISEKGGSLVGRRRGRTWRLGDVINVRVVRIDKLRGKVELEPVR